MAIEYPGGNEGMCSSHVKTRQGEADFVSREEIYFPFLVKNLVPTYSYNFHPEGAIWNVSIGYFL